MNITYILYSPFRDKPVEVDPLFLRTVVALLNVDKTCRRSVRKTSPNTVEILYRRGDRVVARIRVETQDRDRKTVWIYLDEDFARKLLMFAEQLEEAVWGPPRI